jgi:hypothetical protein
MKCFTAAVLLCLLFAATMASSSNCKIHPWPYNNALRIGQSLSVGDVLQTSTSYLTVEPSGRVALYQGAPKSNAKLLWSSNTTGTPANLTFTSEGNLVLYATNGFIIWQSATSAGFDSNFVLQDDCNFVLYQEAPLTNATWATGTSWCVLAHIVPHSHDDVGWLLTPERYYDGCFDPTGGVQSIIGSMVQALAANSSRTFAQVESYFFNRWWVRQNETVKNTCRQVVANEQFQFINGGWSMHDEACVHQESAVANMDVGAQFLRQEFGETMNLTVGWHIDPFGHASATPRLMAQMGFDAFFFWRTDYELRNYNMATKKFETMWASSPSLGDEVLMFTSILYNSYCYGCNDNMCPSPFCCFTCEQAMPNWAHYFGKIEASLKPKTSRHMIEKMFNLNSSSSLSIEGIASSYVQTILSYAGGFRTNNVLMPWGCDFQHIDAFISFDLMDQVMAEVNGNWDKYHVTMVYSTPERYLKAVQKLNYAWPINEYDYFLDSDDGHSYWSGYFSSRAEYKHFERWLMNERVAAEIALSAAYREDLSTQRARMDVFRQALGVAQHHDSITGTEREHVRDRYQYLLTEGLMNATATVSDIIYTATGAQNTQPCHLSNLSSCDMTNPLLSKKPVSVFIYNALAWARNEIVTIPVPTSVLGVLMNLGNGSTKPLVSQVQPVWQLTSTRDPTSPPHNTQPYELLVSVPLPPLTLVELILTPTPSQSPAAVVTASSGVSTILNDHYSVSFDSTTGRIANATNKVTGLSSPLEQNIMYYCPMGPEGGQASGAYIFRTCVPDEKPQPFHSTFSAAFTLIGPVCSEVRQVIDVESSIYQTVRLCHGQDYIDLITGVGEINPNPKGKEVILRIATDIQSNGEFFTDSQGLELQRRIRNDHPNFPYTVTEPVAANFYPCNVYAVVKDQTKSLAVVTDYSRSTSSMEDGELEFLFIRRLIHDDHRGVDQPLNESIRVISSSRLVLNSANVLQDARLQSILHTHKPIVRYGYGGVHTVSSAFVGSTPLPPAITLHTRTAVGPNVTMIRLQHIYAIDESPLAVPTTVDLKTVIPAGNSIMNIIETDLNGISRLEESSANRLQFTACDESTGTSRVGPKPIKSSIVAGTTVQLNPMDIRTYMIFLGPAQ